MGTTFEERGTEYEILDDQVNQTMIDEVRIPVKAHKRGAFRVNRGARGVMMYAKQHCNVNNPALVPRAGSGPNPAEDGDGYVKTFVIKDG